MGERTAPLSQNLLTRLSQADLLRFRRDGFWAEETLHDLARVRAEARPDAVAIRDGGCTLTWAELTALAETLAADLRADCLMELIDIAPTLLEAAEIDVPETIQGRSLLPILLGQADASQHRDHVFSEYYNSWTHKHSYGSMLRTREEKIVVYHGTDQGELYDLKNDPDEFENLWNTAEHAEHKMRLMKACFDASVFTMDPSPPRLGPF